MHFKSEGSTLIEAMIAVTMMGMLLAPVFVLENTIFDSVARITQQFRRYLFAHNFLYEAQRKQPARVNEFSLEHTEPFPETTLRYTCKKVTDGAFKNQSQVYRQEVAISSRDKTAVPDRVVTYIFKPVQINNEQ